MAFTSNNIGQKVIDALGLDESKGVIESVSITFESRNVARIDVVIYPDESLAADLVDMAASDDADRVVNTAVNPDSFDLYPAAGCRPDTTEWVGGGGSSGSGYDSRMHKDRRELEDIQERMRDMYTAGRTRSNPLSPSERKRPSPQPPSRRACGCNREYPKKCLLCKVFG